MIDCTKMAFRFIFKMFDIIGMIKLATYESSKVRFFVLSQLLSFSAYRIIPHDRSCAYCQCLDGENIQDSMFYEWIYDIQHTSGGFIGQILFGLSTIKEAHKIKKLFKLAKQSNKSKRFNPIRRGSS